MSDMIEVQSISKRFASDQDYLEVLRDVSFTVSKGEFVCILGYSGCGKSTLLRIIAGLETQDHGKKIIDGIETNESNPSVLMLFQDFNQLFPWKTVQKNVMYPLIATRRMNRKESKKRANEIIEHVGLKGFESSFPHQLSGGMKQRVAVARALIMEPKVLLMDEPFAALDATTRVRLQNLTKQVCSENEITVLFVTHNVDEAVALADRIIVMSPKTHGVERIINNTDKNVLSKEDKTERISDIIAILDNQLS